MSYILSLCVCVYLILTQGLFVDFRERGRGRERERETQSTERQTERQRKRKIEREREREAQTGCLPHASQQGIKPTTFWCTEQHSNQVSYLARGTVSSFEDEITDTR